MSLPQQYDFSDRRLRDRALLEFARALRNERMVALTGSMSTEALGYDSWQELGRQIAGRADDVARETEATLRGLNALDEHAADLLEVVATHTAQLSSPAPDAASGFTMDRRVQIGVIRDCFQSLDGSILRVAPADARDRLLPLTDFNQRMAELVMKRRTPARPAEHRKAALGPLIESLGINRFATLNYDLELERALMLRAGEREALGRDSAMSVMSYVHDAVEGEEHPRTTSGALPIARDRINRLSRVMGDGRLVESDVLDRERPDRLLEFAIGSSDAERHILHLHGRADRPASMIVDMRDYDRLYRLDDLHRNPFEFGLRVLFAGNPVLFVGLGMTENEVNDKLQYLVSNSPHRRMAPAFLLWNTIDLAPEQRQAVISRRRLDFLQRLGVQVIFDEDLRGGDGGAWIDELHARHSAAKDDRELRRTVKLAALAAMIEALPAVVAKLNALPDRTGETWRSISRRLEPGLDHPVRLWGTSQLIQAAADRDAVVFAIAHMDVGKRAAQQSAVMLGIAGPGFGRGAFAEKIVQTDVSDGRVASVGGWILSRTRPANRLLVNAGFSYDSDAMLNAIALFLARRCYGASYNLEARRTSREELFMQPAVHDPNEPLLIVINGIDRFFGFDGSPLSAELDHLLRCVAKLRKHQPKIQWVLLGTDRVQRYFKTLGIEPVKLKAPTAAPKPGDMRSRYLDWVAGSFREEYAKHGSPPHSRSADAPITPASAARIAAALDAEPESARRAFFDAYLAPTALAQVGADCPTSFEVLRAMSFMGAPVETAVLRHVPKVAAMLREFGDCVPADDYLVRVMTKLRRLGLVIRVKEFDARSHSPTRPEGGSEDDGIWTRYGLHRALATELRERHGVPISESKLSTTFNMSLFAAQPGDNYAPEPQLHDELGELVDRLIGAWKDLGEGGGAASRVTRAAFDSAKGSRLLVIHPDEAARAFGDFGNLCHRHSAACLRAALTVVRSYFSTASLLTLDREDRLVSPLRDGALTEHAERLDRLLKGFGKLATARQVYRTLLGSGALGDDVDPEDVQRELGPEPFYPDDLVWLHNERGVVKMIQGNLYDARRSFSLARRANEEHLERDHRGHNWRRISLNAIGLLVERSRLKRAETRIDQVEASVDEAKWITLRWPSGDDQAGSRDEAAPRVAAPSRVATILELFGDQRSVVDDCLSSDFSREEILAVGLTTAYRGLIAHMRGRYRTAEENYVRGISILRRLGEQRAYALFQRHFAALRRFTSGPEDSLKQIEFSIAAAASVRQMDVSYRARIVKAVATRRLPSSDLLERRSALEDIRQALEYSALTDSYRVRIEASSALAREMRASGDYETALKYASDALAIACRYGHSLHKVSLRVEIGQILFQRGDPKSGNALMDRAVDTATRNGSQRTVRLVDQARGGDPHRHV